MSLLFVSVQYLSYIYHYVKEWRKNPEWSLSCCLALLLPLRNFEGEIGGLAGGDIPMQQLQTGRIDSPSNANTGRDNAAVDISLEDYDAERKEEEEREEEEKEKEEEEEDEDDDTANQITAGQGVVTVVEVIIHPPPSGIQDTKL